MRPDSLRNTHSLTILGLNSGTSADGLDLAVVRVPKSPTKTITLIHADSKKYPSRIRDIILSMADSRATSLDEVIRVDSMLGKFYGTAAANCLKHLRSRHIQIDAIASHGQTVRHLPKKQKLAGISTHGTLQLGSIAAIAAATGKVTVGDFRQADVALGNEGAPITVAAVVRLFQHPKKSRLVVNVGGMANFFYIPAGGKVTAIKAADCGPGNVLSDLLCERLFHERFDRNGRHARKGEISQRLLSHLTRLRFFDDATISTGREQFGAELAARMIADGKRLRLSPDDLVATAIELTAYGICRKVAPLIQRDRTIRSLYLTGGGAFNSFLRERISAGLDGLEVASVEAIGMDPAMTEAASYAVMGAACLWSQPLPTRFGADRQSRLPILGTIAQPPV
ncbi:MAG: anhydro-N-acetylmuramic acid kinase [bacterium]|nr:anhydro-N-acetylmuramic acid kinase [bacterium]